MAGKENQGKDRLLKWFRKYHKWPSLIFTFFIFFFSFSGIILNHRALFSSIDVPRKWLPGNYRYDNWNLAAVKSSVKLTPDSILIFGNIGVWQTDNHYSSFRDFNLGFPKGIDNRKINSLFVADNQRLFAGTLFGLYEFKKQWTKIDLPVKEERIVKISQKGDSLLVMTRSNLLTADKNQQPLQFQILEIPPGEDYDNKTGLFKTLWVIHSGEIYGHIGRLIVDLVGLIVMIITITGLIYWLAPHLIKRVKNSAASRIKRFNKFSLKWHNRLGSWAILILLLTTMTGMFLRPPLLISIANSRVSKIKYTELDNPNPWFDRLRDFQLDEETGRMMIATSEGIYYSDDFLKTPLRKFPVQPPLSVMGITVFENLSPGEYLIGSFSGIFRWVPESGYMADYLTNQPAEASDAGGPPFGAVAVSGFISDTLDRGFIFEYNQGVIPAGSKSFPDMPAEIIDKSPLSLWNTALEVHTGRIYEFLIGKFYILIVPLTGLAMVLILVTGFFAWYIPYRRKRKNLKAQAETH